MNETMTAARQMMAIRDAQRSAFATSLFDQPVSDLLLILYIAAGEGRAIDRAAVTARLQLTTTVATRLIDWLISRQLIVEDANGMLDLTVNASVKFAETLSAAG